MIIKDTENQASIAMMDICHSITNSTCILYRYLAHIRATPFHASLHIMEQANGEYQNYYSSFVYFFN
jgi:hypothetical protein